MRLLSLLDNSWLRMERDRLRDLKEIIAILFTSDYRVALFHEDLGGAINR